jgi:hypothetical protein
MFTQLLDYNLKNVHWNNVPTNLYFLKPEGNSVIAYMCHTAVIFVYNCKQLS